MYWHLKQLHPTPSLVIGHDSSLHHHNYDPPMAFEDSQCTIFVHRWGNSFKIRLSTVIQTAAKLLEKFTQTITRGTQGLQTCQSMSGAICVYRQPCNMSNVKSDWFQLASCCDPPMFPHLHK
jgi:hypothetical protein